jgi:hypothetical protein
MARQEGKVVVLVDENLGAYDLLMTKVDVKHGMWGQNVYYIM